MIEISKLRPTQFAVGMREVDQKIQKLMGLSGHKVEQFLLDHPVPVVLGPEKAIFIIDHHHLVRASWEHGLLAVKTEVKSDLSHLKSDGFWASMKKQNWVYLRDQFGGGPHEPLFLPHDIRSLADDPFRSLAWELREAGGYQKVETPFAEFKWAEYLRQHFSEHPALMGFHNALKKAIDLAKKSEASHLPGFQK